MGSEIILVIGIILIGLLFIDHYVKHGYFYDLSDFTNAIYYLFKSHEGLIVLIFILMIGVLIGSD